MECMVDFVVDDNFAYSFEKIASFDYLQMMSKSDKMKYCPADEVLAYAKDQMLTHSRHTKLLLVLKGNRVVEFQHALCFIRRDFHMLKQLLMLDCKNSGPCVYPTYHVD